MIRVGDCVVIDQTYPGYGGAFGGKRALVRSISSFSGRAKLAIPTGFGDVIELKVPSARIRGLQDALSVVKQS